MEEEKFRVKADLAVFEALQKDGRQTEEALAKRTNIPASTVHDVLQRLRERRFYEIRAVPVSSRFSEIPLAVIGFSGVHPLKVKELESQYGQTEEVLQFFHSEKDVMLVLTDENADLLAKRLFQLMQEVGEKPSLYMTSPSITKFSATLPDKVLDAVYSDLPDRRMKL